jgi:hypothetical protein
VRHGRKKRKVLRGVAQEKVQKKSQSAPKVSAFRSTLRRSLANGVWLTEWREENRPIAFAKTDRARIEENCEPASILLML